jgi:glutamine synthetase
LNNVKSDSAARGVRMIDLKFCDLWGRWHHLTIPASQFKPALMREGIGFDGSAVCMVL